MDSIEIINFIDQLITDNENPEIPHLDFRGKTFNGDFVLNNIEFKKGLRFTNCVFLKPIHIGNSRTKFNITFSDCIFDGRFDVDYFNYERDKSNTKAEGDLIFKRCKIAFLSLNQITLSSISVQNSKTLAGVNFLDVACETLNLIGSGEIDFLEVENCEIGRFCITDFICTDVFAINNSSFQKVEFLRVEFKEAFNLKESTKAFALYIRKCVFHEGFFIDEYMGSMSEHLITEIGHCVFHKNIDYCMMFTKEKFYKSSFDFRYNEVYSHFNLYPFAKGDKKQLTNGLPEISEYIKPHIGIIYLHFDSKSDGHYRVNRLDASNLTLTGNNTKGYVSIETVNVKDLYFNFMVNTGTMVIKDCFQYGSEYFNKLRIQSSLLSNLTLLNVDLSKFKTVDIDQSTITNLKANNTVFFEYDNLNPMEQLVKAGKNSTRAQLHWQNKAEIYKLLRQSMEQSGDKLKALEFRANEMNAYHSYLISSKRWYNSERLIFWLSSSNNFGLSWTKPLWLSIVSMMFFWLLLVCISRSKYYLLSNALYDNFYLFFKLLNPVHDVEKTFVGNLSPNGWTYALDYLSRLVFSFFAFQIVSAFRKHVK